MFFRNYKDFVLLKIITYNKRNNQKKDKKKEELLD